MCECGCYLNNHVRELPGPGDTVYLLTFSPGCEDCSTPAGVIVQIATNGDTQHQGSHGPMPMNEHPGRTEYPVRFVDFDVIQQFVLKRISQAFGVEHSDHWPESFALEPDELLSGMRRIVAHEIAGSLP